MFPITAQRRLNLQEAVDAGFGTSSSAEVAPTLPVGILGFVGTATSIYAVCVEQDGSLSNHWLNELAVDDDSLMTDVFGEGASPATGSDHPIR